MRRRRHPERRPCTGGCGKLRPAGGTERCPDCTLEAKRLAAIERVRKPADVLEPQVVIKTPIPIAVTTAAVDARDRAVLTRLRQGPATFAELLLVLPPDATMSDDQRREALSRSLSRLRIKKREIRTDGNSWESMTDGRARSNVLQGPVAAER